MKRHVLALLTLAGVAASCAESSRSDVDTGQSPQPPFEQVLPLNRHVDVTEMGEGFMALQLDLAAGTATTSSFQDAQWGPQQPLGVNDLVNAQFVFGETEPITVLATSCARVDEMCETGSIQSILLRYEEDAGWTVFGSLSGEQSDALSRSTSAAIRSIGAVRGAPVILIVADGLESPEIWRVGDQSEQLPSPPAGVVDFCTTDDGELFGLGQEIVAAGSVVPGDSSSEVSLEGEDRLVILQDGSWTSTPLESHAEGPLQSASLVCGESGPVIVWPSLMVRGIDLSPVEIASSDGQFLVRQLSAPAPITAILRSSQRGTQQVDEIGIVSGETIEFKGVQGPVVAAAVNGRAEALLASVQPDATTIDWSLVSL